MEKRISKIELRKFGLLIGVCFPIFLGWLVPALFAHEFRTWTLFVSAPFLTLAALYPNFLYYPYKSWMFLGKVLGFINSRLILGLVFILVLQPIAFIMKLSGHDPLKKKKSNDKTFRELRNNNKIDFDRIF